MRLLLRMLMGVTLLSSAPLAADTASIDGALLAASCGGCHRDKPVADDGIASLQELDRDALLDLLKGYRDGSRPGTLMPRLAAGYSVAELAAIADYLASE